MKKIYEIKKYVEADSISQALKLEKDTKADYCVYDEYRTKQLLEDIERKKNQKLGF